MKVFKVIYRDYWNTNYIRITMSIKARTKAEAISQAQRAIEATSIGTASVIINVKEINKL